MASTSIIKLSFLNLRFKMHSNRFIENYLSHKLSILELSEMLFKKKMLRMSQHTAFNLISIEEQVKGHLFFLFPFSIFPDFYLDLFRR